MSRRSGQRQGQQVNLVRRLEAAGLALNPAKVEAVEAMNDSALYGAILLAMFPTAGAQALVAARWEAELRGITDDRVRLNPNLHMAEASMTNPPHLPRPLRPADISHLDLDRFLRSLEAAPSFNIRFVKIYLDPDGNLVLAGRADEPGPEQLRDLWGKAGLWIKGHPRIDGAVCTFHATLTHLPLGSWSELTEPQLRRMRQWLDRHGELDSPVEVEVRELRVMCMARRAASSSLGDDIRLPLGRPSGLSSGQLESAILARFAPPEPSGDV